MRFTLRKAAVLGFAILSSGFPVRWSHAQTGSAPADPWKQPPEGRAAAAPEPMNCSGSITTGDGKSTAVSTCNPPTVSPLSPSVAKRFPYPGASSSDSGTPASGAGVAPGSAPSTTAPSAPQTGAATSTGNRFPYPGESAGGQNATGESSSTSSAASPANPGTGGGLQDAGSSGESSSGSSGSSSSSSAGTTPNPDDPSSPFTDPDTAPAPKRGRKKLPPVPRQSPSEREEEDVKVAGFYLNDGNYKAAYTRAQDAVSLTEDDAEAQLMLAEAARKLGKLDEAQQHYKRCLALDPLPKLRKTAVQALKQMSGGA